MHFPTSPALFISALFTLTNAFPMGMTQAAQNAQTVQAAQAGQAVHEVDHHTQAQKTAQTHDAYINMVPNANKRNVWNPFSNDMGHERHENTAQIRKTDNISHDQHQTTNGVPKTDDVAHERQETIEPVPKTDKTLRINKNPEEMDTNCDISTEHTNVEVVNAGKTHSGKQIDEVAKDKEAVNTNEAGNWMGEDAVTGMGEVAFA